MKEVARTGNDFGDEVNPQRAEKLQRRPSKRPALCASVTITHPSVPSSSTFRFLELVWRNDLACKKHLFIGLIKYLGYIVVFFAANPHEGWVLLDCRALSGGLAHISIIVMLSKHFWYSNDFEYEKVSTIRIRINPKNVAICWTIDSNIRIRMEIIRIPIVIRYSGTTLASM